jgi:hypothetical protein
MTYVVSYLNTQYVQLKSVATCLSLSKKKATRDVSMNTINKLDYNQLRLLKQLHVFSYSLSRQLNEINNLGTNKFQGS